MSADPLQPPQHIGVILPGQGEVRSQFQAGSQQVAGILEASDAGGDLGQHAQGRNVIRGSLEHLTDQGFSTGDTALLQVVRGFNQLGVAGRALQIALQCSLASSAVPLGFQLIAQGQPGGIQGWVQLDRLAQVLLSLGVMAQCALAQAQLVLHELWERDVPAVVSEDFPSPLRFGAREPMARIFVTEDRRAEAEARVGEFLTIEPGTRVLFSPRKDLEALDWYANRALEAEEGLMMTFAFGMNDIFKNVYQNGVAPLRLALMEKKTRSMKTF